MQMSERKWIIKNDEVICVTVVAELDNRYECIDGHGDSFVVSIYDAYDSFDEALDALNEELPE